MINRGRAINAKYRNGPNKCKEKKDMANDAKIRKTKIKLRSQRAK